MNDRFSFVGKLKLAKEDALTTQTFEKSGWEKTTLNMRIISGNDTQFLRISAGKFNDAAVKNGKKNLIYTLKKAENGGKLEKITVEWADRDKEEVINSVAGFKRYTIDLDINTPAEGEVAKRRQYITPYDFINSLAKVVGNEDFKDYVYQVEGDITYSYSAKNNAYYKDFVPTSVKRVASDTPQECLGHLTLHFTDTNGNPLEGSYKALEVNEGADAVFHGYSRYYDEMAKKTGYAPYDIVIPEKIAKAAPQLFSTKNVSTLGMNVRFYNGAQLIEENAASETLTTEQQNYLALGLITMEQIRAERGKGVYGDRVTKTVFITLGKGYTNGPKAEDMKASELTVPPMADATPADEGGIPTSIPATKGFDTGVDDVFGDGFDIFKTV